MSSNCSHSHSQSVSNIKLAFFLNLGFTVVELVGGVLTNSVAIMSDALHDLGDTLSLGLAWYLEKVSNKQGNAVFTYGYKRFSLLGALLNAVILLIGTLFILMEAVPRIIAPEAVNPHGMLLLALLGISVNGFAVYKTANGKTLNAKVVSWHLLEDVLGWVAVLIVSLVMIFAEIAVLDPILSILVSVYILWGVLKNLKQTLGLFLQATPKGHSIVEIESILLEDRSIENVHDTHLWSLDGEQHVLSTHLKIAPNLTETEIIKVKCDAKSKLKKIGIGHATLEIEFEKEDCKGAC